MSHRPRSAHRQGWRGPRLVLRRCCGRPIGAWALAAPLLVQELALVLGSVLMTLLAARLGPAAVAAIGWVEVLGQLLNALMGAIAIGTTVVTAQAVGRAGLSPRLQRIVAPIAADALRLMGLTGLLLALLLWLGREPLIELALGRNEAAVRDAARLYLGALIIADLPMALVLVGCGVLRGLGHTRQTMHIQLLMVASQVLLAAGLMHGAGWGVEGAAVALVVSRVLALVQVLQALEQVLGAGRLARHGRRRGWRALGSRQVRGLVTIGGPAALESLFFHVGKMLTQTLVAGQGTAAMAANFIAFSVVGLINIPGNALGSAATTLVGQSIGARCMARAHALVRRIHRSAAVALCMLAVPMGLLASPLASLYTPIPDVQAQAALLIRLNALFMPVWALSFVLPAALRGAADTRYTMHVAIASMWLCRVGLALTFVHLTDWGLTGIWLGMFADWCLRGLLFWRRSRGRAWLTVASPETR
ncbi:MAG: MATE family efflux transporter [Sphaerotilus natans subsp. sulfidivorans]|uniref:MATE family efflux transporter n=1 Tax=Sphaerotilus sulfidivorans TaxID=639200 RepID=UPI0023537EFE|nr:MATE family efflux transporter [Sphaerotilus sulfidivorans]MCK6403834.1 MATE family efflux transporter [Sphaerotilus sulfidivorans]